MTKGVGQKKKRREKSSGQKTDVGRTREKTVRFLRRGSGYE